MAYTYALGLARASSAANPITFSYAVAKGDTVIALLLKGVGATDRAGGAPTWGNYTFAQANSTQKAAASPEASAELWYLVNPFPGTYTLTIPNTGAITCFYTIAVGRAKPGATSKFDGANGSNGTSTNPTPGAITPTLNGAILFAITAVGAQTWAPTAQAGTIIANTDDGVHGGGEQYLLQATAAAVTMNWTFATSDDWGAVAAAFIEVDPTVGPHYARAAGGAGVQCNPESF